MLWYVHKEDEACSFGVSMVEWRVWDRIRESAQLDEKTMSLIKKVEQKEDNVQNFHLRGGLFFFKGRIYVSDAPRLRSDIMGHFHGSKEGGHLGWLKTYQRVKPLFFWEGPKKEVQTMVAACSVC